MLTLEELTRAVDALAGQVAGRRIQGVVQPSPWRIALETYGPADRREDRKRIILLSCDPDTARVSLLPGAPRAPSEPPRFAAYLKAHVVGGMLTGVRLLDADRLACFELETPEGSMRLILSILGRRSNVYLLDADDRVACALRTAGDSRPELEPGAVWTPPASSPPRAGGDRFADVTDDELLRAIEAHYGDVEARGEQDALERRVAQALSREARRVDRKLAKLERDLAAAEEATQLGRQGELLKGALSRVQRGDRKATVTDHETGEDVTVELDPKLSPSENLERIFKRYRKAVRGLTRGGAQLDAVQGARRELTDLEASFGEAQQDGSVADFAETEAVRALLARYIPSRAPKARRRDAGAEVSLAGRKLPRRLLPRRYRTAEDMEIWVGRSDEANDFLSTRLARGKDLFFHLDGAPGSHVVLRTGGRSDPPSEAVLEACELAVHFSKFKNATRADVHVVPIHNVKKPRGAKPGLVIVHGGKTVHLRRMSGRLERVLGARIDDAEAG